MSDSEDSFHSIEDADEWVHPRSDHTETDHQDIATTSPKIHGSASNRTTTHELLSQADSYARSTGNSVDDRVPPPATSGEGGKWSAGQNVENMVGSTGASKVHIPWRVDNQASSKLENVGSNRKFPTKEADLADSLMLDTDYIEEHTSALLLNNDFSEPRKLSIPSPGGSSPSEPSTQSDSGNEMKEWDKLSMNGGEKEKASVFFPASVMKESVVNQSLLDEWEKGWDENDVTDEDFAALTRWPDVLPPPKSMEDVRAPRSSSRLTLHSPSMTNKPIHGIVSSSHDQSQGGLLEKWGGWGTSFISTASASVSSISNQVGHGLSAVFETVEQGLGAPKPEDLASINKVESAEWLKESSVPQKASSSQENERVSGWLAGLTNKVQSGGLTLVTGSLDVLEGIGKKTMDVLKDKDPGLQQTKAILTGKPNLPVLSQVLREAKASSVNSGPSSNFSSREENVSFVKFFDEEQGVGSWEALEILSSQCAVRLDQHMSSGVVSRTEGSFKDIENLCQPTDSEESVRDENFVQEIRDLFHSLSLGIPEPHKLLNVYSNAETFLSENTKPPTESAELWCRNVHRNAALKKQYIWDLRQTFKRGNVPSLRLISGAHIICFPYLPCVRLCGLSKLQERDLSWLLIAIRKVTEMIYLNSSNGHQNETLLLRRVEILREIVNKFCVELDYLANQFAGCLARGKALVSSQNQKVIASHVTDVFVESANSNRYLQDALLVCIPIFRLALFEGPKPSTGKRSE